jgi:hypothetical protein
MKDNDISKHSKEIVVVARVVFLRSFKIISFRKILGAKLTT